MFQFLRNWWWLIAIVLLASHAAFAQIETDYQPTARIVVAGEAEEDLTTQELKRISRFGNPFHLIGEMLVIYTAHSVTYTTVEGLEFDQLGSLRLFIDISDINGIPVKYLHLLTGKEGVPEGHPAGSKWMSIPIKPGDPALACYIRFFH